MLQSQNILLNKIDEFSKNAWNYDSYETCITQVQKASEQVKNNDIIAVKNLSDAFAKPLIFGTSGLRGIDEIGTNRINDSTISQAMYSIMQFSQNFKSNVNIIIGYDARCNSRKYAEICYLVANLFTKNVILLNNFISTPILSFATKNFNFDVGIMITASHNEAKYNGLKLYLGGDIVTDNAESANNGAGVNSPFDAQIMQIMNNVISAREISDMVKGNGIKVKSNILFTDELFNNYYESVSGRVKSLANSFNGVLLAEHHGKSTALCDIIKTFKIAMTSLHGVGDSIQTELLNLLGFEQIFRVTEQCDPNSTFPTVIYPDPESEGATKMVLELAKINNADFIIANDPDADRVAVGCYDVETKTYKMLTGDEIGTILTFLFAKTKAKTTILATQTQSQITPHNIAVSLTSSRIASHICDKYNINYVETLPGHKNISRVPNLLFGYEESLGYNIMPDLIRDKDGPATGCLLALICATMKLYNANLFDLLNIISHEFGEFTCEKYSIRFNYQKESEEFIELIKKNPSKYFENVNIVKIIDYSQKPRTDSLKTNALELITDDSVRILLRPSGTEPKIKVYLEAHTKK